MGQAFEALSAWQVMLAGLLFFGGIYLVFGAATWLLTRHVLPALGLGRPLDPRPLAPGQLRREFGKSLPQPGLAVKHFITARWAEAIDPDELVDQCAQDGRGVADKGDIRLSDPCGLFRIGIDPDDVQGLVYAPLGNRIEKPRADGEHGIRFRP